MKANIDERFKPSKGGLYGSVAREIRTQQRTQCRRATE